MSVVNRRSFAATVIGAITAGLGRLWREHGYQAGDAITFESMFAVNPSITTSRDIFLTSNGQGFVVTVPEDWAEPKI